MTNKLLVAVAVFACAIAMPAMAQITPVNPGAGDPRLALGDNEHFHCVSSVPGAPGFGQPHSSGVRSPRKSGEDCVWHTPRGSGGTTATLATLPASASQVNPAGQLEELRRQYAADAAAQKAPSVQAPSSPAAYARPGIDPDVMMALLEGDSNAAWSRNFFVSREKFVVDAARVLGMPRPKSVTEFVGAMKGKLSIVDCNLSKSMKVVTPSGTSATSFKCSTDEATVVVLQGSLGTIFWSIDTGQLLVAKGTILAKD